MVKKWFEKEDIERMDSPACSPDFNPIKQPGMP